MIDRFTLKTQARADGSHYDVVRVWIGGVPFSADLTLSVERAARRVADEAGIRFDDLRTGNAVDFLGG